MRAHDVAVQEQLQPWPQAVPDVDQLHFQEEPQICQAGINIHSSSLPRPQAFRIVRGVHGELVSTNNGLRQTGYGI